jgi:hypothetical protein
MVLQDAIAAVYNAGFHERQALDYLDHIAVGGGDARHGLWHAQKARPCRPG